MNESIGYIDDYFNGQLADEDKKEFEARCESDPAFADEVAFYIAARGRLKNELADQKKKEFSLLYAELSSVRSRSKVVRAILPYAAVAAACFFLILMWQLFFTAPSPARLAQTYIDKNLSVLSVKMGNDPADSIQMGITAYNNHQYTEAKSIFESMIARPVDQPEAVKYLGLVYLKTSDNDKAIEQFQKLSGYTQLYANPGPFYEALALMKRSAKGDREHARQLLENVIRNDLPGSREAKNWINNL